MRQEIERIFEESIQVKQNACRANIETISVAAETIIKAFKNNRKVLFFGNGGSAADSQHMAAEFIGRFQRERSAWPAIALTTDTSALTALGNDYSFDIVFARQIEGLGEKGDIAFGISTSGNSKNVVEGFKSAKEKGMTIIALTGRDGGAIGQMADIHLNVPAQKTARVQESHICMMHIICELVENTLTKK